MKMRVCVAAWCVGASGVNSESSEEESAEADETSLPQREVFCAL